MEYPESKMNVAVHIENGLVKIYGHENKGFRSYVRSVQCDSKPQAIHYCSEHNDNQRVSIGLKRI